MAIRDAEVACKESDGEEGAKGEVSKQECSGVITNICSSSNQPVLNLMQTHAGEG